MKGRTHITLANMSDVGHFVEGMRIATGTQKNTLRLRIWRWLTKRNLRVVYVCRNSGYITVERCR